MPILITSPAVCVALHEGCDALHDKQPAEQQQGDADAAWQAGENTLPASYKRYQFWWEMLGYPAFCATVVLYFLMVLKPM